MSGHQVTLDDVHREALHDWLDERPPVRRPDPCEYEETIDPTRAAGTLAPVRRRAA
jgi:hypothetical protein